MARREFTKATKREALKRSGGLCEASGCEKVQFRRGLCAMHYSRLLRHGSLAKSALSKTPNGDMLEWLKAHSGHDENSSCLTFPFVRQKSGYGRVTLDGRRVGAHYAMCIIAHGAPPTSKHEAAHSCGKGNEGCVNPNHLRWATRSENLADRVIHNGGNRGEKHGNSTLTAEKVRQIRSLVAAGIAHAEIAMQIGVNPSTVGKIARRERWGWLDG